MGQAAGLLLVSMGWILRSAVLCCLLPIASAQSDNRVQAGRYAEFWVWGGVDASRVAGFCQRFYLLQGDIAGSAENPVFRRQGIPAANQLGEVVLVYRLNVLAWNEAIRRIVLNHILAWESRGNTVAGIQLDFDAATKNLSQYSEYLRTVRQNLPTQYRLSVTGLMDWASQGQPADLKNLHGVVDEIVFQTYQGRHTVPNYSAYIRALSHLPFAFKVGLVEGGNWDKQHELTLRQSPYFQGFVVFLLPQ